MHLGVERICLGTSAVQDPALVEWALGRYGAEHISADLGVRDGIVMVKGWQEASPLTLEAAGRRFRRQGLQWCVLTDVRRDGVGTGAALEAALELQTTTGLKVIASGGVRSVEEVRRARQMGLAGIILGKALYDGVLSLNDCLAEIGKAA
jgi:phosphoribosylformimino-5-aminoimidazole carboxamide ribotide isomerase